MVTLGIPSSQINEIIDDPTVLHPLLSSSNVTVASSSSSILNIDSAQASQILSGYTHGVRSVFILNAALSAVCVLVAYVMIHHKELIRADEAEMRKLAKAQTRHEKGDPDTHAVQNTKEPIQQGSEPRTARGEGIEMTAR